ncbi:uncharacterized protein LOC111247656 isoform X2 [Varroa destructor]|nr:uncharacterized protein LOC111247656 isoform X2 [Varroa destructor]
MFVGGLPRNCSEDTLFSAMEKLFGRVVRARVQRCIVTQVPKRFGFVTFAKPESMQRALQERWVYITGHVCECKLALPIGSPDLQMRQGQDYSRSVVDFRETNEIEPFPLYGLQDETDSNLNRLDVLQQTDLSKRSLLSVEQHISKLDTHDVDGKGSNKHEHLQPYELFPMKNPNPWRLPWWTNRIRT